MYNPPHFAIAEPAELHRIMQTHPLGVLVHTNAQGLDANHIPFEFDPAQGALGTLTGHVSRNNSMWQEAVTGSEVMVIFRGAEHYISPNWYPTKHETHKLVPTWNYEVVHAHGTITIHDDERFLRGVVARLTRRHEANEPKPWKMGASSADFIDGMLKAIVGIEITVTRLEGKAKFSQNREPRDRVGAIDTLRERGHEDLAALMEQAHRKLG